MYIKDIQIMFLAQFIDVLNVLESFDNLQELKEDIYMRKRICKDQITELKKNSNIVSYPKHIDNKLEERRAEIICQLENSIPEEKKEIFNELKGIIDKLDGY
jgi:hypothetical protein